MREKVETGSEIMRSHAARFRAGHAHSVTTAEDNADTNSTVLFDNFLTKPQIKGNCV